MADLSPQAQAVLDAFNREAKPEPHHQREAIAAALRAAADLVVPDGPNLDMVYIGTRRETRWEERQTIRAELLAIAAELESL